MSDVFFKKITYKELLERPQILLEAIEKGGFYKDFKKGQFFGLKIHFGEKGNKSYINPDFIFPLVKFLKKIETKPFLFETNTLYRGKRENAIDHISLASSHGFAKLNIPIIIGDGIKGNDYSEIEINKKHFEKCFVAQALKDIDFLLVFSHFTGHMLTGFGAAIKNLGMGCAARRGKLAQHCEVSPKVEQAKCIACGLCVQACPVNAIEKGQKYCYIRKENCIGCAECISVCPRGAIDISWSQTYNTIGEKMAEYAYAASKGKKCAYVNFCLYITKECDCMNKEDKGFVEDVGVLLSYDPVSIDKASIDLILREQKKDILKEIHPQIDYLHHLQYAQALGLGSLDYELIEI